MRALARLKDRARQHIARDAAVLATFDFLPRLSNRRALYSLHHVYSGRYTLSAKRYPTPAIDVLVMDVLDPLTFAPSGFYNPGSHTNLQALLHDPGWRLRYQADSVLVLDRGSGGPPVPWVRPLGEEPLMNIHVEQSGPAHIQLRGFSLGERSGGGLLPLTLYWMKTAEETDDCILRLSLETHGERICRKTLCPGSRVWPPQSWPTGILMEDRQCLHVPDQDLNGENVRVSVELVPIVPRDGRLLTQDTDHSLPATSPASPR
jgi:hypothetical protein